MPHTVHITICKHVGFVRSVSVSLPRLRGCRGKVRGLSCVRFKDVLVEKKKKKTVPSPVIIIVKRTRRTTLSVCKQTINVVNLSPFFVSQCESTSTRRADPVTKMSREWSVDARDERSKPKRIMYIMYVRTKVYLACSQLGGQIASCACRRGFPATSTRTHSGFTVPPKLLT